VKSIFKISFLFLLLSGSTVCFSQERVTTVGIQVKPIIPLGFFKTGKQFNRQNNIEFELNPKLGMNFGMVIRKGFTKSLSIETGINYLQRNYDLAINDPDSNFTGTSSFKIVNYEIPLQGLVYVRLTDKMYMNVAGGISFDIYPSELLTFGEYFENNMVRSSWLQTSLLANVGWEYRTDKSGYFYFGASLHRPFSEIFRAFVAYDNLSHQEGAVFNLSGNYFTIDLRYFFHEDKERKRKKIKKPAKKKFIDPRK